MFNKNQIDQWIDSALKNDNASHYDDSETSMKKAGFTKRNLVEAKVYVDRHDTVVTDWIFNSCHKEKIIPLCNMENGIINLWGAKFHFTDFIPVDKALGLALIKGELMPNSTNDLSNSIVLFYPPVDTDERSKEIS